jgi:type I restriction enzyme M protein
MGNPPYVSAGESEENLLYRSAIRNFGVYHFLYQRWDLFVPFFERNLQFLRPQTERMGLIVSRGIETEGYAERLRQHLSTQHHILQLDFFPGSRLFQDAAIENTTVTLEQRLPEEGDEVIRRRHLQPDCQRFETLPPITQLDANGQLFRWRYDHVGRIYPDVWKRLPIKVASTERQQQVATLVEEIQAQYKQLRATIQTLLAQVEDLIGAI